MTAMPTMNMPMTTSMTTFMTTTMTTNRRLITRLRNTQAGLTLVEIMVAITISLVLLAGILQIFTSTKSSYNLQSGVAQLHENARFALDIMATNISMAGFANMDMVGTSYDAFNTANTQDNVTANAALGFAAASGTASDSIDINYQSATNCTGAAAGGGVASDRYYLNNTNLMCIGNGNAGGAVIIAQGIENLQILYGEDTNADGIANVYVNADDVGNFDNVVTVRLAILVDSVDSVSGGNQAAEYTLLDAPPLGPFEDNLYRRTFTRTVLLRNRSLI